MGFYIPEDGILHSPRHKNLKSSSFDSYILLFHNQIGASVQRKVLFSFASSNPRL
jgi:hypothetical protein